MLRAITETENETESVNHRKSILQTISDTLNISQAKTKARSLIRSITESVHVGIETFQRNVFQNNVFQGAGEVLFFKGFAKTVNESVNVVSAKARLRILVRTITESVSISQAKDRLRAIRKVIDESLSLATTFSKVRGHLRIINHTVNVGVIGKVFQNIFQNNVFQTGSEAIRLRTMRRTITETCLLYTSDAADE